MKTSPRGLPRPFASALGTASGALLLPPVVYILLEVSGIAPKIPCRCNDLGFLQGLESDTSSWYIYQDEVS